MSTWRYVIKVSNYEFNIFTFWNQTNFTWYFVSYPLVMVTWYNNTFASEYSKIITIAIRVELMGFKTYLIRILKIIWCVGFLVDLLGLFFSLFLLQCGSWPNWLFHCNRCHVRKNKAWENCRYLWPCNFNESPEELHGSNRRPVHLYPWCTARSGDLWKYRSAS